MMPHNQDRPLVSDPLSLIGNTPLIELKHLSPKPGIRIFAKLEGQNPSGSIKDRIALAMIRKAEQSGQLTAGQTIVEASSGNTGIALAFVARQRGYQVKVVIPEGAVPTIVDTLSLLGVEVVRCPSEGGMRRAIEVAKELSEQLGAVELGQFSNLANVEAHDATGCEILGQIERVDAFVAGIGTGGTVTGVGRRLRQSFPNAQIIGVEPVLGEGLQGLRSLDEGYVPPLLDFDLLTSRFAVSSRDAIACARSVAEREGLLVGVSSGATLSVALRVAARLGSGNIVAIFADGGWKYLPAQPWNSDSSDIERLDEVHWW